EGYGVWRLGDDAALLEVISSANVACGFHAGDARTMRRVCDRAVARGVAIGAQVGYRDLAGFGRRRIEMDVDDLQADIGYQIGAVLTDVDAVVARSVRIARERVVMDVEGGTVAVSARSLCVHGDTPGAVDLARAVRAALTAAGIAIERFAR